MNKNSRSINSGKSSASEKPNSKCNSSLVLMQDWMIPTPELKIGVGSLEASLSRIKELCEEIARECDEELAEKEITPGEIEADDAGQCLQTFPETRVNKLQDFVAQLQCTFERLHVDTIVDFGVQYEEQLIMEEEQDLLTHVDSRETDFDWGIDVVEKLEYQHDYLAELENER